MLFEDKYIKVLINFIYLDDSQNAEGKMWVEIKKN